MLNENLRNLADNFAKMVAENNSGLHGVTLSLTQVRNLQFVLDGAARDAHALETAQISSASRAAHGDLPASIVRLADHRKRPATIVLMSPTGDGAA